MRIVHIYKDYFPVFGGIENHIRQLAEAQAGRGHDVSVLVTSPNSKYELGTMNGVHVTKAPRHLNVQSAPISLNFPNAIRRLTSNADITHLHAPYPVGEVCNLLYGYAKKTVITWHSDVVRQKTLLRFYAPVLRQAIKQADRIIVASEAYARSSPWIRDYVNECAVVPYGIDASRFQNSQSLTAAAKVRADLLSTLKLTCPLIILSVGRLRYYKGFDDLIRATALMPDIVTVLVGIGPMESDLRALTRQLGVSDRVIFAGEVDDEHLPRYYSAADVFALPSNSRAEAFGIVILEAMASGLPTITTELGTATSWVNQDGVTGFVIPPKDPSAIARAVKQLQNENLRKKMGAVARARVLAEFTLPTMVERIEDVYRDVMR